MPTDNHPHTAAIERTYSLEEAAQIICGSDDEAAIHWLSQRLRGNAEPFLTGYKVARRWRMTQVDLDAAIELLRPRHTTIRIPAMTSMTRRSQRRLAVSS